MFLIAAIISAGVLINAIFPVIYSLSGSISSSSHEAEQRLRTDVKIVNTYASAAAHQAVVWLKNVGTSRIPAASINQSDVFVGQPGDFERVSHDTQIGDGKWIYEILGDTNSYWEPGETIQITAQSTKIPPSRGVVYFQFVLRTGLWRSIEFTASD